MGAVRRYGFPKGWQPSDDAVNASPDSVLRADNLLMDEHGVLALRLGSSKINSLALGSSDIRSLYAFQIAGTLHRLAQAGGSVYSESGSGAYSSIVSGFDSSLDVQFTSYLGYAFMASGIVKKKYDGTTLRNWGIAAPANPPSVTIAVPKTRMPSVFTMMLF